MRDRLCQWTGGALRETGTGLTLDIDPAAVIISDRYVIKALAGFKSQFDGKCGVRHPETTSDRKPRQ
ncbi:hypothetical protein RMS29_025360 (plasmid) [Agrobacterium rosae]|uniref:hypothetical protein n=1 Tax=Agrobacterium rosae TaxID=1972867 RepID=UPI003D7BDEBF